MVKSITALAEPTSYRLFSARSAASRWTSILARFGRPISIEYSDFEECLLLPRKHARSGSARTPSVGLTW